MKAAIFDMDGLLIDSEKHWIPVDHQIWKELGLPMDDAMQKRLTGLNLKDAFALALEYKPDLSWDEMLTKYDEAAIKIYTEKANLLPGVVKLLTKINEMNLHCALASSSSLEWVGMVMKRFDLDKFFEIKFSSRSMNLPGKPRPDIYLAVMKELKVEPSESMVFEDSAYGVQAGKNTGAYTVAVPNPEWNSGDYSSADLVLKSLEEFDFSLLKN